MLDQNSKSLLRGLIYPIQFERDPLKGVDRVLRQVVQARALGATPKDYLASVRAALASTEKLAALIPQGHTEEAIRAYLSEVEKRVAAGRRMSPSATGHTVRRRKANRRAAVSRPEPEVAH